MNVDIISSHWDITSKTLKVFVCGEGNIVDKIFYEEAYKLGKGLTVGNGRKRRTLIYD